MTSLVNSYHFCFLNPCCDSFGQQLHNYIIIYHFNLEDEIKTCLLNLRELTWGNMEILGRLTGVQLQEMFSGSQ